MMHKTLSSAREWLPTLAVSRGTLTSRGDSSRRREVARFLDPTTGLRRMLVGLRGLRGRGGS